jgi:flagella basal body P-ring formation protein FlgA
MIRKFILALATLAALGGPATAQVTAAIAPPHPKLKAEAVVNGDVVRVGDLVANAGIIADVPIFRAPDLGATGTVSAEAVREAVRAHALVGLDTGGIGEVAVTRASRTIAAEDIEQRVKRALATQFSLGAAKDIALNFDNELHALHVEPAAKGDLRIARLNYEPRTGRFYAVVELPAGASARAPLRLSGRATATTEVATLVRPIERGAVIRDSDVLFERRPRAEIGRDVITEREHAVGLAARTQLEPGRPLRSAQLMKPEMVQRNESVTLVYQVPGIMLTVRGKAVEGGAEGDVISVVNEQSKRTIQGVIVGPGRVVVSTPSPRLAANLPPSEPAAEAKDTAH